MEWKRKSKKVGKQMRYIYVLVLQGSYKLHDRNVKNFYQQLQNNKNN